MADWEPTPARRVPRAAMVAMAVAAIVLGGVIARPVAVPRPAPLPIERDVTRTPATATPGDDGGTATESSVAPVPLPVVAGTAVSLPPAPVPVGGAHLGVWTGTHLLVGDGEHFAAYDPAAGTWRPVAAVPEGLSPQAQLVAASGQVLVYDPGVPPGAARLLGYGSDADSWQAWPVRPRRLHDAAVTWTGTDLVVLGEPDAAPGRLEGFVFRPSTGELRDVTAPPNEIHSVDAAWTGAEVLVWGSWAGRKPNALAYEPLADRWREVASPPLLDPGEAASVWTGTELVLWGRPPASDPPHGRPVTGAAYDPVAGAWALLPLPEPADPQVGWVYQLTAAWTGTDALFVGGYPGGVGLAYRPADRTWRQIEGLQPSVVGAVGAWTGESFLRWGGYGPTGPTVDLDEWRPT